MFNSKWFHVSSIEWNLVRLTHLPQTKELERGRIGNQTHVSSISTFMFLTMTFNCSQIIFGFYLKMKKKEKSFYSCVYQFRVILSNILDKIVISKIAMHAFQILRFFSFLVIIQSLTGCSFLPLVIKKPQEDPLDFFPCCDLTMRPVFEILCCLFI